jgi:hypothetical protein
MFYYIDKISFQEKFDKISQGSVVYVYILFFKKIIVYLEFSSRRTSDLVYDFLIHFISVIQILCPW